MSTAGWFAQQPCPDWCRTGHEHLTFQMQFGSDDFWHQGAVTTMRVSRLRLEYAPEEIKLYLSQREDVDPRGHYRHPIEVCIDDCPDRLSAVEALTLAALVNDLAELADHLNRRAHDPDSGN